MFRVDILIVLSVEAFEEWLCNCYIGVSVENRYYVAEQN